MTARKRMIGLRGKDCEVRTARKERTARRRRLGKEGHDSKYS